MSYAVTDAVEQDMRAEYKKLCDLSDELDQHASEAREVEALCPEAKPFIDIAWYFTEKAIRETRGCCSAHRDGWCPCCHHFNELKPRAERMLRAL